MSVTGQLLGRGESRSTNLRSQNEGLHELPHRLHVVGQLAHHLHHHALVQGGVGVHVPDLSVAVAEAQSHHPLVDLLQTQQHLRGSLFWKTKTLCVCVWVCEGTHRLAINRLHWFSVAVQATVDVGGVLSIKPSTQLDELLDGNHN